MGWPSNPAYEVNEKIDHVERKRTPSHYCRVSRGRREWGERKGRDEGVCENRHARSTAVHSQLYYECVALAASEQSGIVWAVQLTGYPTVRRCSFEWVDELGGTESVTRLADVKE